MNTTIRPATEADYQIVAHIAREGVADAHRASCSTKDLDAFLAIHYNDAAIKAELLDSKNIYHLIYHERLAAGFCKIILNTGHPNIPEPNACKLDRIYLLKEFYGLQLGWQLLAHAVQFSKEHKQSGIWLFTWVGNKRAIDFYRKAGFKIIGSHEYKISETHYNPNHQMWLQL